MVKLVKSDKDLSEWGIAVVNTSLSTSSLPTQNARSSLQQSLSSSPTSKDSGIAIDEPATGDATNQDQVKKRIGDEELPLLTPSQPNSLIASTLCAHLTPSNGSLALGRFSTSLSSMGRPLCRICHLVHETTNNPLITPCRCSGTMQYVHIACLVHWLEISAKKMYPRPRCELCGYSYKRHPCIDLKHLRAPHVDAKDVALNIAFVFAFAVMVICAAMSIHFLRVTDQYHSIRLYRVSPTLANNDDLTVITCSVLFFIAFFIAVFTQYRAEASIFRVFFRFWLINRNWQIRNYDISDDPEMLIEKSARRGKVDVATNTERCVMLV